jgi:hypothetical protein
MYVYTKLKYYENTIQEKSIHTVFKLSINIIKMILIVKFSPKACGKYTYLWYAEIC